MHFSASADCSDINNVTFAGTMNIECPGFNPSDPTTICDPTAQGAITMHILNGDCDPPKNLRPGNIAYEGLGGISQGGRWGAGDITTLGQCNSSNTQNPNCGAMPGGNSPSVYAPPPSTALNLLQAATAMSNVPSTLPASTNPNCSPVQATTSVTQTTTPNQMALPILNQTIAFSSAVSVGNLVTLGNVTIGTPPIVPSGQGSVINNLLATGNCAGSVFPVPNNTIFVVAAAGTTQAPSTYSFTQDASSNTQLVPNDAVDLNFNNFGVLNLPQGAAFNDPTGAAVALAAGSSLLSMGDGTNRIVSVSASGGQIVLPSSEWNAAENNTIGLPQGTYGCNYDSNNNNALINCYVLGTAYTYAIPSNNVSNSTVSFIPVNSVTLPNLIVHTSAIAVPANTSTTATGTIPPAVSTTNITPAAGSYFHIPAGTPVGFSINTPGSITLPSGANFLDPNGNSIYLQQNTMLFATGTGTVIPALVLGNNQIQLSVCIANGVPQFASGANCTPSNTAVGAITTIANGLPASIGGASLTYPATTTMVSITTTAVGIPAGASIPVNTTCSAINPQTTSSTNPTPVCPSI